MGRIQSTSTMCRGVDRREKKTDYRSTEPSQFLTPTDPATEKKIKVLLRRSTDELPRATVEKMFFLSFLHPEAVAYLPPTAVTNVRSHTGPARAEPRFDHVTLGCVTVAPLDTQPTNQPNNETAIFTH